MVKSLTILGATGSIGTQALEVVEFSNIRVDGLSAGSNVKSLSESARKFNVKTVAIGDESKYNDLKIALADTDIKVLSGVDGICQLAAENESEIVLNSIVGIAGLKPSLAVVNSGKNLALANKESLVTGGELVKKALKENGNKMLPVDSEHSAIFQCLQGVPEKSINKIILTASGGPFFNKTKDELENITPKDALKHPNWNMGSKITIDSSTLMNKGLEVIEAVHLFDVDADDIEVVVQRQSILHSAVEFKDFGIIAQLGTPDMKLPIQYALTYPDRIKCPGERLDLIKLGSITFEKPDTDTFRCLPVCIEAIKRGGLYPTAVNGANEKAVELFLKEKISFLDIGRIAEKVLTEDFSGSVTVENIFEADKKGRSIAENFAD